MDGSPARVFLGGPFAGTLSCGRMDPVYQQLYTALIRGLEDAGFAVFSAHRNEEWGARLLPPGESTPADFAAVSRCDVFVAIPGDPPSLGTHVEIGWASALGKPLVLLTGSEGARCALVRGIGTVARARWVALAPERPDVDEVVRAVRGELVAGGRQWRLFGSLPRPRDLKFLQSWTLSNGFVLHRYRRDR